MLTLQIIFWILVGIYTGSLITWLIEVIKEKKFVISTPLVIIFITNIVMQVIAIILKLCN